MKFQKLIVISIIFFVVVGFGGNLFASLNSFDGEWLLEWWAPGPVTFEDSVLVKFITCVPDYFNPCNYDYKVKSYQNGSWGHCGTGSITNLGGGNYKHEFNVYENEFSFRYSTIENFMKGSGIVSDPPTIWWAAIPVKASLSKY